MLANVTHYAASCRSLTSKIFGVPAVQAVIHFKWVREPIFAASSWPATEILQERAQPRAPRRAAAWGQPLADSPSLMLQDKWAMQDLLYEFYIFLVWLISFQLFVWLFQVQMTFVNRPPCLKAYCSM